MQDYRNEVKEFFSSDEQLAAEVEFILKSAEKQQELEEQMSNCSLAAENKTAASKVSSFYDFYDHSSAPCGQKINCNLTRVFLVILCPNLSSPV